MCKEYLKPELRCETIELGVFGNYSGDDDGSTPRPVKVTNGFQLHMD
jgi:hypothetical protein